MKCGRSVVGTHRRRRSHRLATRQARERAREVRRVHGEDVVLVGYPGWKVSRIKRLGR